MKYDYKKQLRSFRYAWQGIRTCLGKEQNLSFHLIVAVMVGCAGGVFGITRNEWLAVIKKILWPDKSKILRQARFWYVPWLPSS